MTDSPTPLDPDTVLVGPAYPVRCEPGDNLAIHRAIARAAAGDVLVVDAAGRRDIGHFGDIMTSAAQYRKLAGLIIDGGVRDARAIVARGFPVFHRGLSVVSATKIARDVEEPELVTIGGCAVRKGDMIVADRDGVVVVPAERVDDVARAAHARDRQEREFIAAIETGKSTLDVLGLD